MRAFLRAYDLDPESLSCAISLFFVASKVCDWRLYDQLTAVILHAIDSGSAEVPPFLPLTMPASPVNCYAWPGNGAGASILE